MDLEKAGHASLPCLVYYDDITLTKNEITFGPISILFCTKSLLKAQK